MVLLDLQNFVMAQLPAEVQSGILARVSSVIAACRARSIPVIYVRAAFRLGFQEHAPSNRSFARMMGRNIAPDGSEAAAIHPAIQPRAADCVVVKKRVSAFRATDLELVLRSMGVRHLMLAGVGTSGCVLSTVRAGADLDFVMTVLSDCCADRSDSVHSVLMESVFPNQAVVETAAELLSRLTAVPDDRE